MKKILVLRGVPTAHRICFVMDMPSRILRMQNQPINFRSTKVEHAGFMVIDPDDSVVMTSHASLPLFSRFLRVNSRY